MCNKRLTRALVLIISSLSLADSTAWAEAYIAGQFGVSAHPAFTDMQVIQVPGVSGLPLGNAALKTSALYGAKIGYFLPNRPWLGLETEFFYTNPHFKQQALLNGLGFELLGAHVRVATLAFNLILRSPGERFQPYAGAGLGIYWARISGVDTGTASDTSPGVNVLAGSRLFLTKSLAFLVEYKYNRATFDFGNTALFKADYSAHNIVFGVGYHF